MPFALPSDNFSLYLTFRLLDTAQIYANEEEAGIAIRESGLARNDIFVTTKYSGVGGLDIETSVQNSLKKVIHAWALQAYLLLKTFHCSSA